MSEDLELAALLGEAPASPDPAFHIGTMMRVALRRRRRAAQRRAVQTFALFSSVGLAFAFAEFQGMPRGDALLFFACAMAAPLGYGVARIMASGPQRFLARSVAVLAPRL